jgi:hypothetical protein
MSTSSFYLDVTNPLYRDNGCPSQCMSANEYTTVGDYYSFGTDPKTALLNNLATADAQTAPTTAFGMTNTNAPVKLSVARTGFGLENTDSSNYKGIGTTFGLKQWPPQHVVVARKP